jgi:UDP-N-acetylmuramate dehydrogenase
MNLREHVPLSPLTTLGVGGAALYFVEADNEADVREALIFAKERDLPLFVLGGGSNLVVSDAGFDGLVLRVCLQGIDRSVKGDEVTFQVAAGEDWDSFVARAVEDDCAGIECLSGIPGSVGATPVQNVGAYGQEVSETICEVVALDRQTMELRAFGNSDCGFGYRTSIFNTSARNCFIILRVSFSLQRGGSMAIRYADLQKHFGSTNSNPTLQQVRDAVLHIRRSKSMVLDPDDENRRSVGSFFKNPILTQLEFDELARRMQSRGVLMPSYLTGDKMRKLSAAWLVEQAGFHKGYQRGAAGISSKHSLAIVNLGGAKAAEIVALKDEIQSRVLAEFGISLQPEPVLLGF